MRGGKKKKTKKHRRRFLLCAFSLFGGIRGAFRHGLSVALVPQILWDMISHESVIRSGVWRGDRKSPTEAHGTRSDRVREEATPSEKKRETGPHVRQNEREKSSLSRARALSLSFASAPPPTAYALQRGGLDVAVGDREGRKEAPFGAAFLRLSLSAEEEERSRRRCSAAQSCLLSFSLLLARGEEKLAHPSSSLSSPPINPLPSRNRPAHAGLAGHGLEDGDRHLRGL